MEIQQSTEAKPNPIRKTITVAAIAAGVQFGWALQLSLLTPYVQTLGVPHAWASFIWLCGPISGLLVQPIVGFYSDRCTSSFGRRRPFIVSGALCVCLSVILIGFAKDIGYRAGDPIDVKTKPRAVALFVVGFWILDVANNMLQGPCRAFLADLSGGDHRQMRMANAFFAGFMGAGNILGYAAGSLSNLYKILPFTKTEVCDVYCANLKTCFLIDIVLLLAITVFAVLTVSEVPLSRTDLKTEASTSAIPFFGELSQAFKNLSRPMWILLLVTALNWIAWFPFFLYNTDWMGAEVYGGKVDGNDAEQKMYDMGVRAGSLGLMFNSILLLFASMAVEPVGRLLGGVKRLWGIVNIILAIALFMTIAITKYAKDWRSTHGLMPIPDNIKGSALAFFTILGIPLSVTFSIPFALASVYCQMAGGGQGLSLGVVNMSIVLPQMFVSVVSGPLDAVMGGGNLPAFGMGGIAAVASAVLAIFLLPNPPAQALPTTMPMAGGH